MEISYSNFFDLLLKEVPEFRTQYDEYVVYSGELIPHPQMGEFARFVIDAYRKSKSSCDIDLRNYNYKIVINSLNFLEKAMNSSDRMVVNLISVSFLENLLGEDVYDEVKVLLGPNLRIELNNYE